jgi:hypothetical protein
MLSDPASGQAHGATLRIGESHGHEAENYHDNEGEGKILRPVKFHDDARLLKQLCRYMHDSRKIGMSNCRSAVQIIHAFPTTIRRSCSSEIKRYVRESVDRVREAIK